MALAQLETSEKAQFRAFKGGLLCKANMGRGATSKAAPRFPYAVPAFPYLYACPRWDRSELEMPLVSQIQSGVRLLVMLFSVMDGFAQAKAASSSLYPAPQIAGRFVATDGSRSLTLHYVRNAQPKTLTGLIQSRCMLPAGSTSGESKPLDLSAIPLGTPMTEYYVRRQLGKDSQNVILSMRFDVVRGGFPRE